MTKITTDAQALAVFDALVVLMNEGQIRVRFVDEARTYLAARLASTSPAPDGWVLVPREPNVEMSYAGARSLIDGAETRHGSSMADEATFAYAAMIAAADMWEESEKCPNCVSPWKCNGPHIGEAPPSGYEEAAAPQPVVEKENG